MISWLKDNDIETYSIHNEGKSVVAERFIRALKNKVYKYMTSISQMLYINKQADIDHSIIKVRCADVKSSTYINFAIESNDKNRKFEVGDHAGISKHKSIFAKGYATNCSEKVFLIKKGKNTAPWTYVNLIEKKLLEHFIKKNLKRQIKRGLGQKK